MKKKIKAIKEIDSSKEFLLKKGYYKITFNETIEKEYIVVSIKENIWSSILEKYIDDNYSLYEAWSLKKLDYILDHRDFEGYDL